MEIRTTTASRMHGAEPTGRLDPVHHRHADVQEDELGTQLGRQRQCFLTRGCLAQRLETRGGLDHFEGHASEGGLVVHDEDADPHRFLKRH